MVAVLLGAVGWLLDALSTEAAVALAAVIVTVSGLLVAVLQWRIGLSEKAFDALYQRIALGNQMRLDAYKGVTRPGDAASDDAYEQRVAKEHPELYRFFVYTEIDSFEYATRRYQSGLGLSADIVDRAVRHFRRRCEQSQTFREVAGECIAGAYFDETRAAVQKILDDSQSASA